MDQIIVLILRLIAIPCDTNQLIALYLLGALLRQIMIVEILILYLIFCSLTKI